jgi:lysophospholipase L1-like esterase
VILLLGTVRIVAELIVGAIMPRSDEALFRQIMILHAALAIAAAISARILRRRNRHSLLWLRLLAIGSPLLLLASADRICLYLIPQNPECSFLFESDAELDWRHRPGGEGMWDGTRVVINGKGLRGPEVPYAKAPGEFRILFLGDSVAFGYGVDYDKSFAALVQQALNAAGSSRRCTTIACAVSGYSPWQEAILLAREGLKYKPDLVVQCFCLNDVTDKLIMTRFGGDWAGREASVTTSALDWSGIYRLTVLARAQLKSMWNRNHAQRRSADVTVLDLIRDPDSLQVQEAWGEARKDMRDIVALCRKHGIPLTIACFPHKAQLEDREIGAQPQEELRTFCAAYEVPYLDLLRPMQAWEQARPGTPDIMMDQFHPTATGHAVIADGIVEFLHGRRLVPDTGNIN